jgi:hypothetical protein
VSVGPGINTVGWTPCVGARRRARRSTTRAGVNPARAEMARDRMADTG